MTFKRLALFVQDVGSVVERLWFSIQDQWHYRVDVPFRRAYSESFALRCASQIALCVGIVVGLLITRIGVLIGAGVVAAIVLAAVGESINVTPLTIGVMFGACLAITGCGFLLALGSFRLLSTTARKILGSTFAVLFGGVFLWLGLGLTGLLVKLGLDIGGFFEYAMLDSVGIVVGTLMIALGLMLFMIAVGIAKATPAQVRAYG